MVIKIPHGLTESPFFIIAQPKRKFQESHIDAKERPTVELTDPKSKKLTLAELYGCWTVDENDFVRMNDFALLAYGMTSAQLKPILLKKYPQLQVEFNIEYWLLKRL